MQEIQIGGEVMDLFEAHLKDGRVIKGDNWDLVPVDQVKILVVHHPWRPDVSVALCVDDGSISFLWKEGVGGVGQEGKLVRVGFGKRQGDRIYEIVFSSDSSIGTRHK